jgi:hypothetical protein
MYRDHVMQKPKQVGINVLANEALTRKDDATLVCPTYRTTKAPNVE